MRPLIASALLTLLLTACGQTGRDTHHIGLSNSHLKEALREFFLEGIHLE